MKKSSCLWLTLTALILIPSLNSYAQLTVGIRGGVNFAVWTEPIVPYIPRKGANFALLFNKRLSPILSIQIEPGFSQRGARFDDISDERPINGILVRSESVGDVSFNYFELPVLFQYKPKIGKLEGIISLGPELRFRAGAAKSQYMDKIYENGVLARDQSGKRSFTKDLRDFDYGLAGGAGLAYPLHSIKIFTEARYHLGLRKIYTHEINLYNRGASVHLGILVPIEK
jgi:hypothetical protein